MATYRTIRMSFWSDLYVETLSASEKLLYLYLFSCPHTNNLGVLAVSTRRMAYDTGLTQEAVHAALSLFERDRKIVMDGDTVWLCNVIRHQCSTSPKILASLRALFPAVESADIREAILARYPHLFEATPRPADRVLVPSRESERELEKKDLIGTDGFFVPVEMLERLQCDFPDVDVQAEITRIRNWQASQHKPIRNLWTFLRTCLSNAVKGRAAHAAPCPIPSAPALQPEQPAFRTLSESDMEQSRVLARRALAALRGNGTFSVEPSHSQGVTA